MDSEESTLFASIVYSSDPENLYYGRGTRQSSVRIAANSDAFERASAVYTNVGIPLSVGNESIMGS